MNRFQGPEQQNDVFGEWRGEGRCKWQLRDNWGMRGRMELIEPRRVDWVTSEGEESHEKLHFHEPFLAKPVR